MEDVWSFWTLGGLVAGSFALWGMALAFLITSERDTPFSGLFGSVGGLFFVVALVLTAYTILYAAPLIIVGVGVGIVLAVILLLGTLCFWVGRWVARKVQQVVRRSSADNRSVEHD